MMPKGRPHGLSSFGNEAVERKKEEQLYPSHREKGRQENSHALEKRSQNSKEIFQSKKLKTFIGKAYIIPT